MLRKTDRILQHLATVAEDRVGEVAAAIGETEEGANSRVGALLNYLKGKGFIERDGETSDSTWRITGAGREWIEQLVEEDASVPAKKTVREAKRVKVAKAKRDKAADPERLAPLPRRKVQPLPAVSVVEQTPVAPVVGRQIAIRDDGAVLVIEDDVVLTTLIPEDALKIARVIQTLSGARA